MLQTEISGKFIIYFSCFSLFVYFLPKKSECVYDEGWEGHK